jgi:hypothetical protein
MWASKDNHKDMVRLLLEYHADVNIADNDGWTALMKATSRDPRSRSIACFTVWLVVSGPGVNNVLSFSKEIRIELGILNVQINS